VQHLIGVLSQVSNTDYSVRVDTSRVRGRLFPLGTMINLMLERTESRTKESHQASRYARQLTQLAALCIAVEREDLAAIAALNFLVEPPVGEIAQCMLVLIRRSQRAGHYSASQVSQPRDIEQQGATQVDSAPYQPGSIAPSHWLPLAGAGNAPHDQAR